MIYRCKTFLDKRLAVRNAQNDRNKPGISLRPLGCILLTKQVESRTLLPLKATIDSQAVDFVSKMHSKMADAEELLHELMQSSPNQSFRPIFEEDSIATANPEPQAILFRNQD